MINSDYPRLSEEITAAIHMADSKSKVTEPMMKIWWRTLKPFHINQISSAIDTHILNSKFKITPHDVIAILESQDGRPSENEAWAMSLASQDENETIVWTEEMAEAFGVANQILITGDKQGAKMAFREVYAKLVNESRKELKPVRWNVSLGHDKTLTNDVINQAVIEGKLSHGDSTRYLIDAPTEKGEAIAGLLTGKVVDTDEQTKEKLEEVKKVLAEKRSFQDIMREKNSKEERERRVNIELKKKEVEEYVNSNIEV